MKKHTITVLLILLVIVILLGIGWRVFSNKHQKTLTPLPTPQQPVVSQPAAPAPTVASTSQFNGVYDVPNSPGGNIQELNVYSDSPTTILFYLDLFENGNLGNLYDRVTETTPGVFTYYKKNNWGDGKDDVCNFTMSFTSTDVTVASVQNKVDDGSGCGFGNGVIPDGVYKKTTAAAPQYFINGTGDKVYFKDTPPEKFTQ